MNEPLLALLAWSVCVACLMAFWLGRQRHRPAPGQLRRVVGAGAAVGGLALVLFSLTRI